MRIRSRRSMCIGLSMLAGAFAAGSANAGPLLQLYIEGATYDTASESWYYPGTTFRLWAIANMSGPGGSGGTPITNVRLSAVYDSTANPVSITLTPAVIDITDYPGFADPSLPIPAPIWVQTDASGGTPLIGGNQHLPGHGEYGAGRTWQEFLLSDFSAADSQMPDFLQDIPVPGAGLTAQIHVYDVQVEGAHAHFDLYGQTQNARGHVFYHFAPPSHDATDGPEARSVPLPATLALLGIGALGLGFARKRGTFA